MPTRAAAAAHGHGPQKHGVLSVGAGARPERLGVPLAGEFRERGIPPGRRAHASRIRGDFQQSTARPV